MKATQPILKVARLAVVTLIMLFLANVSLAQMRQVYLDGNANNQITKLSFYSPSEGFVAFTNWVGYTTDSGKTYIQKSITANNVNYNGYSVNLTFGFSISGIKAFNKNTIIVYGNYGFVSSILYSTDGGNTFKLVYYYSYDALELSSGISDMVFPTNDNVGYAVDADYILRTIDKGLTWQVIYSSPGSFFDHIEAIDDNNAYAMSTSNAANPSNKALKTTNGGGSWQSISFPNFSTSEGLGYVFFLNASTGWAGLFDNTNAATQNFYKTTNGGLTWVQQNNTAAEPFSCGKMKFINDSTGYALEGLFNIYKTFNSGATWEPLPRDNAFTYLGYTFNDLQFASSSQLWAGGGHGFLALSTNGGGTPLPKAYFLVDTTGVSATNTVNLVNYSRTNYSYKWYVNGKLVGTNYNITYQHAIINGVDTITLIVSSGTLADTATEYQNFIVPKLPFITSFSPPTGSTGTLITLAGTNFTGVTSVTFGNVAASSFTVVSDKLITATIAGGATGSVSTFSTYGSYSLPGFTYFKPPTAPAPAISSFKPASGPVGTTITITGNNFSSSATENIVSFGATNATVISASPTVLVCTVPVGASYEPIKIINKSNGLVGQSLEPFNVTFSDSSSFKPNSFTKQYEIDFDANTDIRNLICKDIDGDGKPDLSVNLDYETFQGYYPKHYTAIYRNTSTGNNFSFDAATSINVINKYWASELKLDDFDGDGRADIFTLDSLLNPTILLNTSTPGAISFANKMSFPNINFGLVTDIDNDGRDDIVSAASEYVGSMTISITKNTSSPGYLSFAKPNIIVLNDSSFGSGADIAVGDIDGDGKKDILCYTESVFANLPILSCLLNTGSTANISFAAPVSFPVTYSNSTQNSIRLVDYDNDGRLDVLIVNSRSYNIFKNLSTPGKIAFASAVSGPLDANSISMPLCVSNLSGSSLPDIFIGNTGYGNVTSGLVKNISTPGVISSDSIVTLAMDLPAYFANCADFNIDGKLDIAITDEDVPSYHRIEIYKNAVTPSSLPITLLNFTATPQKSTVLTQWQTATEENSSYFNVQRSTDAVHFTTVGKVTAAGNSTTQQDYTYNDDVANLLNTYTTFYYRLQEVDKNGDETLSKVIKVVFPTQSIAISASPNPVKDVLTVRINNYSGNATLGIFDMVGRKLQQVTQYTNSANSIDINTASLAVGTYIISTIVNGVRLEQKFVKE